MTSHRLHTFQHHGLKTSPCAASHHPMRLGHSPTSPARKLVLSHGVPSSYSATETVAGSHEEPTTPRKRPQPARDGAVCPAHMAACAALCSAACAHSSTITHTIFVIKNKVESCSRRGCTLPPGVSNIYTKIAGCKADPGCTAAAEPACLQAHPPMQSNRQYYAC